MNIEAIRAAFEAGARAFMTTYPIARPYQEDALEQAFLAWVKDQKFRSEEDATPALHIEVSVGLWHDPKEGRWKCYAEGWETTATSADTKKDGAEMTILDNGFNNGEPLYWRTIRAEVPLPVLHRITVMGQVDPVTDP